MSEEVAGRRRILVMDDQERERRETARILGDAGYAVDTAATKADVVTLLTRHGYDLVLADLQMPDLTGPALYKLLKESCRTAPPVIFRIERGFTPQYANFLMRLAAPVLMKRAPAADLCLAVERQLPPGPAAASSLAS
ncbi:MAG TPA: response regulator [Candidatus Eisenbacteria bacterium]|nr:response regulator [Candidatus Eisenbacteria bacterium]